MRFARSARRLGGGLLAVAFAWAAGCATTKYGVEGLSKAEVAGILDGPGLAGVGICHRDLWARDKTMPEGGVTLFFVIDGAGKVASIRVLKSTLNRPDAEECIMEAIRPLQFPAPRGGTDVRVTYTFNLAAGVHRGSEPIRVP